MPFTEDFVYDLDVAIIGAGISGINAAYRVQTELPGYKYAILEARNAMGGTWDLFRYPGIRSDSDLHTFGFPWRPWIDKKSIADGQSIREYINASARAFGIDQKIRFQHRLMAWDWSSEKQRWTLQVDAAGLKLEVKARFVIISTGYYNYQQPLEVHIPGLDSFNGTIVHPQFWPEDLDYTNKKIVIIGSGATAITLLPKLVSNAAYVTMLQRSPSYIMAIPTVDRTGEFLRRILPARMAARIVRWKFVIIPWLVFKICRYFPGAARRFIRSSTEKLLPASIPHDPNFNPTYNPWEQRLCISPDGDFFQGLRTGKADVVTDHIQKVTTTGIQTRGGKMLDADIIVTATGLKIQLAGGAIPTVDGKAIKPSEKYLWRGIMLQDMPNAAFVLGYTNASWTLGADNTARLICRLLKHMDKDAETSVVPRTEKKMDSQPILNLNSTYIEKAKGELPIAGDTAPWLPRSSHVADSWAARWANLRNGLQFTKAHKSM